jgi:muramoyltetrapeptide carboxypeptidase
MCTSCSEKIAGKRARVVDMDDLLENKDLGDVCRRIGKLDIVFVATGSGIDNNTYRNMRAIACKYGIKIPSDAMINKNVYRSSDSEENRLGYFQKAINEKSDVIWAMRGGFGSNFIIDSLHKIPIPNEKKTLIGFSDITALNLFVSQKWGWRSIHASVFANLAEKNFSKENFDTLLSILENRIDSYEIDGICPINSQAKTQEKVVGKLSGGNLTIIETGIGTSWEIQTDNKILFIEDVNSKPWWTYRSLHHLKEIGKLNNVKAIIFGSFENCGSKKEVEKFLRKFAESTDMPVYITEQFGHGKNNKPFVYNAKAVIQNNKITIAKFR